MPNRSPHLYIIGGTAARVSRAVRERHERSRVSQVALERFSAQADQMAYTSARRRSPRPTPAAVAAFRDYWLAFLLATEGQEHVSDATRLRLRKLAAHAAEVAQEGATRTTSANTKR